MTEPVISLIISASSLLFLVACTIMGIAIRAIVRVTSLEGIIKSLVDSKERTHDSILESIRSLTQEMKDDRLATNDRLVKTDERIWELLNAIRGTPRGR